MSVYNDMASDAGYKYGTRENEQLARLARQLEQEKQESDAQQAQAAADAQAHLEYMQGGYEGE